MDGKEEKLEIKVKEVEKKKEIVIDEEKEKKIGIE